MKSACAIRLKGWLGREDSNLRMVESKSDDFANDFNAHSEFQAVFDPKQINSLEARSECRAANLIGWSHAA